MAAARAATATAAVVGARVVPPNVAYLVTDFDGTVTAFDTTPLVPHLAMHCSPCRAEVILASFRELEDAYFSRVDACKEDVRSREPLTPPSMYDAAGLGAALASMDDVSNEITEQLSQSGILAGIENSRVASILSDWRDNPATAACRVPALQAGCEHTLSIALEQGWQLGILSLNWCPPIIQAMLPLVAQATPLAEVWCNRIDELTGRVINDVDGAAAKMSRICTLRARAAEEEALRAEGDTGTGGAVVVYVGDSATDLLAMMAADIGILIGDSGWAREVARKYGVRVEPLSTLSLQSADDSLSLLCARSRSSDVVWEAQSWEEIGKYLGLS